jgi:hypothetical protein
MDPIYEKIDQYTMKKVVSQEIVLNIPELRDKRKQAEQARDRFLAEAAAQQLIIDAIDADIIEGEKINVRDDGIELPDPKALGDTEEELKIT